MKNLVLLSLLFAFGLNANSQTSTAGKSYTLLINSKQYHNGDSIGKNDIKSIETSSIQIVGNDKKQYRPSSYEWVVSIKAPNSIANIWKGKHKTNPPDKNDGATGNLTKSINQAQPGDIVFLDQLEVASAAGNVPKSFSLFLK